MKFSFKSGDKVVINDTTDSKLDGYTGTIVGYVKGILHVDEPYIYLVDLTEPFEQDDDFGKLRVVQIPTPCLKLVE